MYRLYDLDTNESLKESPYESVVFNELCKYMENSVGQRYLILWDDDETKTPDWISIRTVRDFYNYALDYNRRLKEMGCVELKREILECDEKVRNKTRKK